MTPEQYAGILQELAKTNNYLERLINATEKQYLAAPITTCISMAQGTISLVPAVAVGDIIQTLKDSDSDGKYFRKGDRGRVIEIGEQVLHVDFKGQNNVNPTFFGPFGDSVWWVFKDECIKVEKAK